MIVKHKRMQTWLLHRKYVAILVFSLAITVFLRAPYYQHEFTFVDEAWWANGANVLCSGGQLYLDVALDKNPPIFWFCAFLFRIFGISMSSIHAGTLLLVGTTSVLLFFLGKRFFSPAVGAAAAVIHAVASTTYYIPRIIGMNTETLMVVFSAAAAGCALAGLLSRRGLLLFLAGFLSSFAFLAKPVAVTETVFLAVYVLCAGGDHFVLRLRRAAVFASGFVAGVGGFLVYVWREGIMSAWWEQAISYGFRYVGQVSAGDFLVKSLRANISFLLIFAWLFILVWLSRRMRRQHAQAYGFAAFWTLSAFLGVVIGRRYYANYFIQVIPPLSLLGAIGLVYLWKMRRQPGVRLIGRICAASFLCSFLWFHSRTFAYWASLAYPQIQEARIWNMGMENRINREISGRLIQGSSPGDRIFVWGSQAELYFMTGRGMATPWMDFDVINDYPPRAAEQQTQAVTAEELSRNLPRYIVDVQPNARIEKYPDFRALVEKNYLFESAIAGHRLFRLRWQPVQEGKKSWSAARQPRSTGGGPVQ